MSARYFCDVCGNQLASKFDPGRLPTVKFVLGKVFVYFTGAIRQEDGSHQTHLCAVCVKKVVLDGHGSEE